MTLSTFRWGIFSCLVTGATMLCAGRAQASFSCNIGFNDQLGLGILDPSEAYGFMAPFDGPDFGLWYYNVCSSTQDFFYFQEDSDFEAHGPYGHFHIPPDDPKLSDCNAFLQKGFIFGKTDSSGNCQPLRVDPVTIDRYVNGHLPDEVLLFTDTTRPEAHWRPRFIDVLPFSAPVRVAFQTPAGVVWMFDNLTPGHTSFLNPPSGPGTGGVVGFVSAQPGSTEDFAIDNIVIDYTND